MTTYSTGNPVPSTDVRDLFDNAENLDYLLNGPLFSYLDRLGVPRKSWAGILEDFQEFLLASGYEFIGDYDSGPLNITARNQIFAKGGEFWRASAALTLPYTTIENWVTDQANFVSVGDAVLRQDLNSTGGGALVRLSSGDTVQEFVDDLDADVVPFTASAPVAVPVNTGEALSNLQRTNVSGIFETNAHLSGFRFGPLAYRLPTHGRAELLSDLNSYFPAGAKLPPLPKRQVFAQFTPAAFTTTGTPDLHRSINTAHDFWGVAGTEQLQAAVIDNATGRKYADLRSFPASDYSCQVVNSAGFGGLTIDIKQPAGVAAPATLVVELAYPVSTQPRAIFVDPVAGNDLFDGSSFDWPMKTIPAAVAKAPSVIFLKPGIYVEGNYPGAYTGATDLAIRAVGGRAQFIGLSTTFSTWTLHAGTTYVSTVGGSPTPVGVVDTLRVDAFGAPRILTNAGSLAVCQATPNSFYYDALGPRKMYANMVDGTAPTNATVYPYGAINTFRHSSATAKVYLSDIDFIGGTGGAISARDAGANGVLIVERGRFLGNYNSNGADIKDVGHTIFIDCMAAYNANDGFNYIEFNGIHPHFIEIGCFSYGNFGGGTGNGTTSHGDCIGLRLNCDTFDNTGPGFADVGNAKVLNVNCSSKDNGPNVNASGFRADGAGSGVVLHACTAYGNGGADIEATTGAVIKVLDVYALTVAGSLVSSL